MIKLNLTIEQARSLFTTIEMALDTANDLPESAATAADLMSMQADLIRQFDMIDFYNNLTVEQQCAMGLD